MLSIFSVSSLIAWILLVAVLAGSAYQLLAAYAVSRLTAERAPRPSTQPPVTLLKPLCGDEPGLLDNLQSFWRQDYPAIQMVCGVRDPHDPAIAVVRALQAALPDADIALVIDSALHGANRKVSNLMNMMAAAKHDMLVLSDSDMRVTPSYLNAVVATLTRPGIGLATCLYIGRPVADIWSRIGAQGINFGFLPSAAVSKLLGGAIGCYGATIALRRQTLDSVGGFAALKDQLADDYALGELVRRTGQRIAVAPHVIDTIVDERDPGTLFRHEMRWARTIRNTAPVGFAASAIIYPLATAPLAGAVGLTVGLGWPILAAALTVAALCRLVLVATMVSVMGAPAPRWWLLLPRDVLSLGILILAYCGRSVSWRNSDFRVDTAGTLLAERETRS